MHYSLNALRYFRLQSNFCLSARYQHFEVCQLHYFLATTPKRANQSKELHTKGPKQNRPKPSRFCLGPLVLHSLLWLTLY